MGEGGQGSVTYVEGKGQMEPDLLHCLGTGGVPGAWCLVCPPVLSTSSALCPHHSMSPMPRGQCTHFPSPSPNWELGIVATGPNVQMRKLRLRDQVSAIREGGHILVRGSAGTAQARHCHVPQCFLPGSHGLPASLAPLEWQEEHPVRAVATPATAL